MTKAQFGAFCDGTADATLPGNQELTHAARCCLSRYRQIHGSTFEELGLLFLVSHNTAKTSYTDIMMYILMMDPFKCAPTMLNRDLTREEVRFMVYIWSFSKCLFCREMSCSDLGTKVRVLVCVASPEPLGYLKAAW